MIEDMTARGLSRQTQRGHILACKRFAAYLKRSPDTATAEDVRLFQLQLMENGLSIQNRNRTMTGVRFLLRVTMRRHDLAAEVFHMKEPQKNPQILSAGEAKRLLTMAGKLQARVLLSIGYDAGRGVTFKYKDYRVEGPERYKVMTLAPHEFIRRFLLHVLPSDKPARNG